MINRVSIFCASSSLSSVPFMEATREIVTLLVQNHVIIQYGGGAVGLMGCIADTALKEQGQIKGIIPRFMVDEGWVHTGVKDMQIVKDMAERKHQLMYNTDAIIVLPGGFGTLEELTEAITLKQLGQIRAPILIMNIEGFFNSLFDFFEKMIAEKFIRAQHKNIWEVFTTPKDLFKSLFTPAFWNTDAAKSSAAI